MKRYKITDLIVDINFKGSLLNERAEKYEISCDEAADADITIDIDSSVIQKRADESGSSIGYDGYEYVMTGTKFYRDLLAFDGFMLHSSAVVADGRAYLFSAPSGTGKSTHTALWEKLLGDRAYIINDDKPAIKLADDGNFYVYGTPWSGKTDKNVNTCVPLQAICFLERSEENYIEPMGSFEAVRKLVWQTIRPRDTENLDKFLSLCDKLIRKTGIYKMGCRIDIAAAELAYNTMKKAKENT